MPKVPRQSALGDATAGAIGSLLSMIMFYPIDVIKTNLQAGKKVDLNGQAKLASSKSMKLLRGMHHKVLHTLTSSFAFFFLHSWIASRHKLFVQNNNRKRGVTDEYNPSALVKVILSAVAALLNTCLTFPLDAISTRSQIESSNTVDKIPLNEDPAKQFTKEEIKEIESHPIDVMPRPVSEKDASGLLPKKTSSPWKGIVPSLLLCTNPAINFTIFDLIKIQILRKAGRQDPSDRLTMVEAFRIGLLAKLIATVVTYPLIRAKIMLMVSKGEGSASLQDGTLWGILRSIMEHEGILGFYKGCKLQLFHTILKSALLMMIRERISGITRSLFVKRDAEE